MSDFKLLIATHYIVDLQAYCEYFYFCACCWEREMHKNNVAQTFSEQFPMDGA